MNADSASGDRSGERATLPTLIDLNGSESKRVATQAKPRDRAVFIRMSGQEAGRLHTVEQEPVNLGRGRDCAIQFEDITLSRVHARVFRLGGHIVIEDPGSLNGVFVNDDRITRAELRDGDRVRLATGASLRFQIVDADEQQALHRMYEASVRDGLTGLYNRKHLDERLAGEFSFALRHASPLSVVILDLDHFKHINDTHGHLIGDVILKKASVLISSLVRTEDTVARYGGEEFVVIARGTAIDGAAQLAERVRVVIERTRSPVGDQLVQVTVSAGAASLGCLGAERSVTQLLALADERLYRAKESGRNRIVAS